MYAFKMLLQHKLSTFINIMALRQKQKNPWNNMIAVRKTLQEWYTLSLICRCLFFVSLTWSHAAIFVKNTLSPDYISVLDEFDLKFYMDEFEIFFRTPFTGSQVTTNNMPLICLRSLFPFNIQPFNTFCEPIKKPFT